MRGDSTRRSIDVTTLQQKLRRFLDGQMVRPFALAAPVLVLLVALPLLRPLRYPADSQMSGDEMLRLATVRSLVTNHSLELGGGYASVPGAVRINEHVYSAQPPMMALLLWAPAWVMTRMGFTFAENNLLIAYVLTLLGVALPVAGAAGLIYRMGRLFELRRPVRAALGFFVVAASGLLSYATVLNPQAPAACLLIASVACLVHVALLSREQRPFGWFMLSGICAALAAAIDPTAAIFVLLLPLVIVTLRFSITRRAGGILLFILGVVPVIGFHAIWNIPLTGDILPASVHGVLARGAAAPIVAATNDLDSDEPAMQTIWNTLGAHLMWTVSVLVGEHGLLSHFPVLIFGLLGIAAVMHRHWPGSTKTLAAATGIGAIVVLILYRFARLDWAGAMFANRWFILFTPLLLFWAGAWMRKRHSPGVWGFAGLLLMFSMFVGLIGATDPMPHRGFARYTAADVLMQLIQPQANPTGSVLAGREP